MTDAAQHHAGGAVTDAAQHHAGGAVTGPAQGPARVRPVAGDRGSGTVLALALGAGVVVLASLLGLLAGSILAGARAHAAADLAALAAAARLQRAALFEADDESGSAVAAAACPLADAVASRNGARLRSCEPGAAGTVTVQVAADGPVGTVTAGARAGPRPPGTPP